MSENILVVEYEPRYIDRVRQALAGQPVNASYAKDGEEALRLLGEASPRLIVLSSVIPKISTPDLIRAIRERNPLDNTPILLTVSGYKGTAPKQDALRFGATDILPKPFTEADFLSKVQQLLGTEGFHPPAPTLTSTEIFGDLLDSPAPSPKRTESDVRIDKMLADTLGGVMPKKAATAPGTVPKPKTQSGSVSVDKMIEDTLSGLDKSKKPAAPHPPVTPPAAVVPPARAAAPPPPAPAPPIEPVKREPVKEEEEPTDGIRFGQYVLLEKIATGGMAEVWKARKRGEEGFQKIVAIKKILPHLSDDQDFIGMFVDEAKLAAQLNHNNIIHIYDLGKIQNSYFIAMEYVDGADLKTIIRRGRDRDQPLGVELALFVTTKVAAALDYAHRKRDFDEKEMELVHRDVSPQNVLISHEGDIKLCDFGIAKATSKGSHTQAGALKGKLQYMSPEQAWGHAIDRRSDIFALAAVLFEMLTQRKLFSGDNEMSVLEQVREARIVAPSTINDEVPPEVDAIVLKGLAKDPSARYQTAGEMAKDIDAVLYSFRPTPTSADLAIYMHRLHTAEPVSLAPEPVTEVVAPAPAPPPPPAPVAAPPKAAAAPIAAAAATPAMPAWDAPPTALEGRKRSAAVPAIIAVVLVAGLAGAYFFMRGRGAAPASAQAAAPVQQVQKTPSETGTVVSDTASTIVPALAAPTIAQDTAIDPNLIDQEVQKRLAAERARLAEQARQQAAASAPAPPPVRSQPQSQPATQTVASTPPPPAVETRAPEPEPAPVTETRAAQPAVETTASQRFNTGDLVPAGTEGLVPARITRRATVPYPPMARAQKVQGTVICSVLVSETGAVLDVRILRGIARSVGLNEAAQAMMRRSTFTPPTKDGVRVKAWTTVPVEFKL